METLLEREAEKGLESKKVVRIGSELRDGLVVWWEEYEDGTSGPENLTNVSGSNPEEFRNLKRQLELERGIDTQE